MEKSMNSSSFALKASLLATLLSSGMSFAQSLPDEIDHIQYLDIYRNLNSVYQAKIQEYQSLAQQKTKLEADIAQMQKDQREIPARNSELQVMIQNKRQEIANITTEIASIEAVLSTVINDLKRMDAMIAQLQRDHYEATNRSSQIRVRRDQVAQDTDRMGRILQGHVQNEREAAQALGRIDGELNKLVIVRQETERERRDLIRNVDYFKREVGNLRQRVNANQSVLSAKKPLLADAQNKLPGLQTEVKAEQAKVTQADASLSPEKNKLNQLNSQVSGVRGEISSLERENQSLKSSIQSKKEQINAGTGALNTRKTAIERELGQLEAQENAAATEHNTAAQNLANEQARVQQLERELQDPNLDRNQRRYKEIEKRNAEKYLPVYVKKEADARRALERATAQKNSKAAELQNIITQISQAESRVVTLEREIKEEEGKIAGNEKTIAEKSASISGITKQISDQEGVVRNLENAKEAAARKVTEAKSREEVVSNQIAILSREIQHLEQENNKITRDLVGMEKAINDLPQNLQRLQQQARNLDQQIDQAQRERQRQERIVAHESQRRMVVERDFQVARGHLEQVNRELGEAESLAMTLNQKLQEQVEGRNALAKYNENSIRKYDALKVAKTNAENDIAGATQELQINEQDLRTISSELPKLMTQLSSVGPRTEAARVAMDSAQRAAATANQNYSSRMNLYQMKLDEAQKLGASNAGAGTTHGLQGGSADARSTAARLAMESGAAIGKWEAMRRGYVRGEISGFSQGFEDGMSSTPDAQRGAEAGRLAGMKRALDHANQVLKPEAYLNELERRLKDDQPLVNKMNLARALKDSLSTKLAAHMRVEDSNIPELTQAEILESQRIISSLDAMIEQTKIEIKEAQGLRQRMSDSRQVYSAPQINTSQNVNCSGVYKNVKELVDACKESFSTRYESLYQEAHAQSFHRDYGSEYSTRVNDAVNSELARLYPVYLQEAGRIGKDVGLAAGKLEIYQQSFNRAELAAYNLSLPQEKARVERESETMVEQHLATNPGLTVENRAKLATTSQFGISPGASGTLNMIVKNAGGVANQGNSLVKITEVSGNVTISSRQIALPSVSPRSKADLEVLGLQISDNAEPGSRIIVAGEITHPGNHYRTSRTESFRLEKVLGVNPAAEVKTDYDADPKIKGFFGGTNKHTITVNLTPKHPGVEGGYSVKIEEVGSDLVNFLNDSDSSGQIRKGETGSARLTYKLPKNSKGKSIKLKVTVSYDNTVLKTEELNIVPK